MGDPDRLDVDWRAVVAASMDGVGILDGEQFVHADEELASAFGYDGPDALVGESWRLLYPSGEHERIDHEIIPQVRENGSWRGEVTGMRADGSTFPQELSVGRADGEALVWAVRDIEDRTTLEHELERYETIVETVTDAVYALDEDIQFSFVNEALCETFGRSRDEFLGTDGRKLFKDADDAAMADEIRERVVKGDTSTGTLRATLPTPEGDRSFEARYRLHPEPDGEYRGSVGVIRDVTEREEREHKLERQRDELATLDRINGLLLEITQELVGTATREAIERTVCARLAESDLYRSAWTGERELGGERVVARVGAGEDAEFRDGADDGESMTRHEPATQAIRTGAVQTETIESTGAEQWREAAFDRGFRSVVAVPLRYRETIYGVLVVYAARPDAFSERERHGFDVLGETIGFAINAIKRRQLLFADTVTELSFRIADSDPFLVRVSGAFDCELSLDGYVSSGNRWIVYLDVDGVSADRIAAEAVDEPSVVEARSLDDEVGPGRLELVVTEPSLLHAITPAGGQVRSATFVDGEGEFVIDVPADADVHEMVEQIDAIFDSANLLARRERDRTPERVQALGGLLDDLTARQRGALETAFRSGYFDWPRASTAEDVATALDVAPPTFHGHLRKAEGALFETLFE